MTTTQQRGSTATQPPRTLPASPVSSRVAGAVTGVVSQTAVLAAVLYYFGWARSDATFAYFGLDPSVAGYSTADYVLRSLPSVFPPLVGVLALLVAGEHVDRVWVRPRLRGVSRRRRVRYRRGMALVRGAAVAVQLGVVAALVLPLPLAWPYSVLVPIALSLAAVVQLYGDHLGARLPKVFHQADRRLVLGRVPARRIVFVAALIAAAFWALGLYAAEVGEVSAEAFASGIADEPAVVLFTTQRLGVSGPGVTQDPITQPDNKYRYVYRGLRLLARTSTSYVLLPVGWRRGTDPVTVLDADDTVRVDVVAPPG